MQIFEFKLSRKISIFFYAFKNLHYFLRNKLTKNINSPFSRVFDNIYSRPFLFDAFLEKRVSDFRVFFLLG